MLSHHLDALLYCRGLQPPTYTPTLLDVAAAAWRVFEQPTLVINRNK